MFKCKFCDHVSKRSDNIKRHENEKHRKLLKKCTNCGKSYTATALSRHKKSCNSASAPATVKTIEEDADVVSVLAANNIPKDQIAGVAEHTINIKFITLKNGTVLSLSNEISIDGYKFKLTSNEPDGIFIA